MAGETYSLASQFTGFQPLCTTKVPSGDVIMTDGISRGARWNGRTTAFHMLGIDAPTAAMTAAVSGAGGGASAGVYKFYYRYFDIDGNYSSLSPVASVTAVANNQFDLSGIANAPNTDSRIVGKQVWMTTAGQTTTLYLGATINNNTTTTATITLSDATLIANAAANATLILSIVNPNGTLSANRFTPPPNFKAITCFFQDRMWYAVDIVYDEGTADFTNGSPTVNGTGTNWTTQMAGRHIVNLTAGRFYTISSVTNATTLTISENYAGTTSLTAAYAIRPSHTERNQLYFSEASEPESVPTINTVKVQQSLSFTDDEIVGLQTHSGFMYILKGRSTLKLKYVNQPQIDTSITSACQRGAFNNRCWDMVEDVAYVMDEFGPYRFNGDSVEVIGHRIMDYWRDGAIDFTKKKHFWVKVDPETETVRFGVSFSGETRPQHVFRYHYRLDTWGVEVHHEEMGAACVYPISSRPRTLLGGQSDVVFVADDGYADHVNSLTETGTMYGTVTSATSNTLTDSTATFTATMVGAPVGIIAGTGKGQRRVIASQTGTQLTTSASWATTPDSTSVYLVGCIEWGFKTKRFRYEIMNKNDSRGIRLIYEPTTNAAFLDIRRFPNHETNPENNRHTWDQGDGLSHTIDDPDAVVNLQMTRASIDGSSVKSPGYVRFEFDTQSEDRAVVDRWVLFHLRGFAAREAIKIPALEIEGVR